MRYLCDGALRFAPCAWLLLRGAFSNHCEYYEHSRTHPAFEKDAPASRAIQPPALVRWWRLRRWLGCIIATSEELPESIIIPHPIPLQSRSLRCPASVTAAVVLSCLKHQAVAACDEDQEDLNWMVGGTVLVRIRLSVTTPRLDSLSKGRAARIDQQGS